MRGDAGMGRFDGGAGDGHGAMGRDQNGPDGDRQAVGVAAGRVGKGSSPTSRDRAPRSTPRAHRAGRPAPRRGAAAPRSERRADRLASGARGAGEARPIGPPFTFFGSGERFRRSATRRPARDAPRRRAGEIGPGAQQGVDLADLGEDGKALPRHLARRARRWRRRWGRPRVVGRLDGAARGNGEDGGLPRAEQRPHQAAPAPGPVLRSGRAGRWACRRRRRPALRRIRDGGKRRRRHDAVAPDRPPA